MILNPFLIRYQFGKSTSSGIYGISWFIIISYKSFYRNPLIYCHTDFKRLTVQTIPAQIQLIQRHTQTKINSDTWLCHIETVVKHRVTIVAIQLLQAVYDVFHWSCLKGLVRHSAPVMTKSHGRAWSAFKKHWQQQLNTPAEIHSEMGHPLTFGKWDNHFNKTISLINVEVILEFNESLNKAPAVWFISLHYMKTGRCGLKLQKLVSQPLSLHCFVRYYFHIYIFFDIFIYQKKYKDLLTQSNTVKVNSFVWIHIADTEHSFGIVFVSTWWNPIFPFL